LIVFCPDGQMSLAIPKESNNTLVDDSSPTFMATMASILFTEPMEDLYDELVERAGGTLGPPSSVN
jgi:hypothetical protein